MSKQYEFVTTDPAVSLKPGKSTQVRSRCMRGVNKREDSRRSRHEMMQRKRDAQDGKAVNVEALAPTRTPRMAVMTLSYPQSLPAPRYWARCTDIQAQHLLFRSFAFNVVNQPLTPLAQWVDFDNMHFVHFDEIFRDAAFLHSILFASHTIGNLENPYWNGKPGTKVLLHQRKTIDLLSKKIEHEGNRVHLEDSVLYVIFNLLLLAVIHADWIACAAHFAGLRKIIQLRGGMDFLHSQTKLHFKIDRIDLTWSLSTGQRLFFLHKPVSWGRMILPPSEDPKMLSPGPKWDPRLTNVFLDMQSLVAMVNEHARTGDRYPASSFQTALSSIQSRLDCLSGKLETSLEELVRLSLLALLTTNFKMPGIKVLYTWLSSRLREIYFTTRHRLHREDQALHIWIIITAAIATGETSGEWLSDAWKAASFPTAWPEIKSTLIRVMWIESIHDRHALAILPRLVTCPAVEPKLSLQLT